jgi:hypothetical protein
MSLHPHRTRAYLCGALAGAFTTVALLGRRDGSRTASGLAVVAALVCGALSVAFEAIAQQEAVTPDRDE